MARWCAARSSDSSRSGMLGERTRPFGSIHGLCMARLMMLSTLMKAMLQQVQASGMKVPASLTSRILRSAVKCGAVLR